jgi:hypothetical protein
VDADEARSAERAAQNERAFRAANEKIDAARRRLDLDGPVPYLCECESESCTQLIPLDAEAYGVARADATRFLIVTGHPARGARVVEDGGSYVIVEKHGTAGE